jgi:hypothetical protein
VQSRTYPEAELAERLRDRGGATDGADRSIEGHEEAVAGGVDLAPTEPTELLADERMMPFD